jgi:hypothetical protein
MEAMYARNRRSGAFLWLARHAEPFASWWRRVIGPDGLRLVSVSRWGRDEPASGLGLARRWPMTTAAPSAALVTIQPAFTDAERVALAGFLAG